MVIDLVRPAQLVAQVGVEFGVAEIIGALRIAVVIAVIVACRRRSGAGRRQVGERRIEVRIQERAGVGRAGFAGKVNRAVLVRLDLVRVIEKQRQLAGAALVDQLGIELIAALAAIEIPGARCVMQVRQVSAVAFAEQAGVVAQKGARGVVAAHGLLHAGAARTRRVARIGFDRAA